MVWPWFGIGLFVVCAVIFAIYRLIKKSTPTVEELVTKALEAGVIDEEFAEDLRSSADLEEALGMFYTHAIEQGDEPDELLRQWRIIE
jgi:hypothetical protein